MWISSGVHSCITSPRTTPRTTVDQLVIYQLLITTSPIIDTQVLSNLNQITIGDVFILMK